MSTKTILRMPAFFDDFMRPWSEWFDDGNRRIGQVPAVNITEDDDGFRLSVAVPGMKKSDFEIDLDGNQLTIGCSKEESQTEKDAKYTRKEYSYHSFERSFTLPDDVNRERIDAFYENGVLVLMLPKKEEARKQHLSKHISIK